MPIYMYILQRVRIACNATAVLVMAVSIRLSVRLSICLSVLPSHSGVLSRQMKLRSRGFHSQVAQSF